MDEKQYAWFSGSIFTLVATFHLCRILFQWDVSIDGWSVPMMVNVLGVLIAGTLAWVGLHIANRR